MDGIGEGIDRDETNSPDYLDGRRAAERREGADGNPGRRATPR